MSEQTVRYSSSAIQRGILVVTVDLDELREHEHSYGLRNEVVALLDSTKSSDLVLDIGKVHFISSVGLLAFLGIRRHMVKGRIIICNISKNVQKMFEYCRLLAPEGSNNGIFESSDSVEDAIRRLTA